MAFNNRYHKKLYRLNLTIHPPVLPQHSVTFERRVVITKDVIRSLTATNGTILDKSLVAIPHYCDTN